MAALLTSYASLPAFGTTALAELVSTIDAGSPCACRTFAASCASTKFDVTLRLIVLPHVSSGGVRGAGVGKIAAVLTTESNPPNCSTAARTAAAIVSREVRSSAAGCTISADDSSPASSAASSAAATFWSATTTWPPRLAICSATSRPMPLPPPTTTTTLRLNSFSGGIRWSFASSSAQYSMRNASSRGSAT